MNSSKNSKRRHKGQRSSAKNQQPDQQQSDRQFNMAVPISKLRWQMDSINQINFKQKKVSSTPKSLEVSHDAKKGKSSAPTENWQRLATVWVILVLGAVGLACNLYGLQIVRSPELANKAKRQQIISLAPFIPRRSIVDRNQNFLAIDRPAYTLYVHPKLFTKSKEEIAKKLSSVLKPSQKDLLKQFNKAQSGIRLENSLLEETADQIRTFGLDGLELIPHSSRLYPQQELAADVVGYVDTSHKAQAGVELSQENLLKPADKPLNLRMRKTGNGSMMPDDAPPAVLNFDELQLQLTIDIRLQQAARAALKAQIEKYKAKRGTVIVMDASNGALLALVCEPSYDPNKYFQYDVGLYKNWAVTDLYEPGSTFKPLNVAIALELKAIKPNDTFIDNGHIQVGSSRIKNAEGGSPGELTIAQILERSSNVGMVQIVQKIKPSIYYGWLERLGLGQKVETDLPSETASQLKSQERFTSSSIESATASFGQGFSITPLQLAQLHGAIANGGKLVTPHVVRGLIDSKGQLQWQQTFPAPRPIFSPKTSQTVLEMMETVVDKGTGKAAKIPGYRIGGKTGTAQKASATGGYSANAKITSFVGILPVDSPRYVVIAVVDEPKGRVFGSTVAAPIVKSVMESLIAMEQIPPSSEGLGNRD